MSGSPPRQEVTSLEEMQRLEERRAAQRAGSRGSDAHYRFRSPILGETEEEQRAKEAHLERFVQGYREEAAAQAEREAASSTSFLEAAVLDAVSV
ncbi:unnamed protein product [Amoebophrya sp. A25]|nr:unnamed protein product [Amoebophrya sp. A25]|eukprot:GSA25T00008631001.1